MISKATVHKATVLMNRRIKTERRVTTFGPVCSSVAGMALHHPEGRRAMQEVSASVLRRIRDSLSSCHLVIPYQPCYGLPRDERISGGTNSSSAIATRNRKWAQAATAWLASRSVSPNAISIAGMCACIAAGLALGLTSVEYKRVFWLLAALGAQLR